MKRELESLLGAIETCRDALLGIVIHLNDTYLLEERAEQQLPGFARVTATVRQIRERVLAVLGKDLTLVVHSGDFLGPSRVGKVTQGATMVEVLNNLGLHACVLGNHEFDYGADVLVERLGQARFKTVLANVKTDVAKLEPIILWPERNPIVALTGVVSETVFNGFPNGWEFTPPRAALEKFVAQSALIPFRIVLTHATRMEDRVIRQSELGHRTILLGGHDHDMYWEEDDGVPIMKNLANLQTVRVVALWAGGASRIMDLLAASDELEANRYEEVGPSAGIEIVLNNRHHFAPTFPDDCEEVLKTIPARDAMIFRNAWNQLDRATLSPEASLVHAITRLPSYPDHGSFLLKYHDHVSEDVPTRDLIASSLEFSPDEGVVIRDMRDETSDGMIDVRDQTIRRAPTSFGVFVAECVRRATNADIAILNSGAFRTDACISGVLRLRDLLDCFLYDGDRAIVVIELPYNEVTALLAHGEQQAGGGGYPQVAPHPLSKSSGDARLRVAIASYWFLSSHSVDGYSEVLSRLRGIGKDEIARDLEERAIAWTSIVGSVREKASDVPFVKIEGAAEVTEADSFICLAEDFLNAVTDAKGVLLPSYRELLKHDEPLENVAAQVARDALRDWIRALPEATAVDAALRQRAGYQELEVLRQASMERLRSIHSALAVHPKSFQRRRNYPSIFNFAANRIGGWMVLALTFERFGQAR